MTSALRAVEGPLDASPGAARTPPHSVEAERALIGAILLHPRAYDQVSDFLIPEHFTDPANARIYEVVRTLIGSGMTANPVTLQPYLALDELVLAAGGMKYVAGLANSVVTVINAGEYGRIVYGLFLRRELINIGEEMVDHAFNVQVEEHPRDIAEEMISRLADAVTSTAPGAGPRAIGLALQHALKRQEATDKGEVQGISCGLENLDLKWGFLQDGNLTILAGRPSMGKSALVGTISYHVARRFLEEARVDNRKPKHVAVFSQEMTEDENADRLIAGLSGIRAPSNRFGQLSQDSWDRLAEVLQKTHDLPLVIDERPRATLGRIRAECRRLQRKGGVGLVVIDYLQIMGVEKSERSRDKNRTQELGYLVTGLKDLAKELKCPIIALSQLNRGVEQRDDKRPTLADLRESGEIEQAADVVAFCFREEYYLERGEPKRTGTETAEKFNDRYATWMAQREAAAGRADIIIAKARSRSTGTAKLLFDGPRTWFSDEYEAAGGAMPDGRPAPPVEQLGLGLGD